jgi:hypothetical protein
MAGLSHFLRASLQATRARDHSAFGVHVVPTFLVVLGTVMEIPTSSHIASSYRRSPVCVDRIRIAFTLDVTTPYLETNMVRRAETHSTFSPSSASHSASKLGKIKARRLLYNKTALRYAHI